MCVKRSVEPSPSGRKLTEFSNKLHFLFNCMSGRDNSILNKKCGEPKCSLLLEYMLFLVVHTDFSVQTTRQ